MLRKIAFGSFGLLLLISPIFVSAQSISDLQAQIQALLAQIAALQTQQSNTSSPTPPVPTYPTTDDYPTPTVTNVCPSLSYTMQRGARDATTGGQVSALQAFLAHRFSLNDDEVVTGYFGATTDRYVKQFQTDQGLPAYGIVGSLTRAMVARVCAGYVSPVPSPILPVQVPVPPPPITPSLSGVTMTVTPAGLSAFVAQVNVGQWTSYTYEIDFGEGDGSVQTPRSRVVTVCNSQWTCSSPGGVMHTYGAPGLYYINLYAVKVHDTGERTRLLAATASARASDVPQNGITVTAPNGGQQWEIGTMNTITWTPYEPNSGVNPSQNVSAYLFRKLSGGGYESVGKIVPSGKASIHWEGHIVNRQTGVTEFPQPGQYYIHVVNDRTGAEDTSDSPFTLSPRSVDLKVNGSDGPVSVDTNQLVTVSWTATNVARCELHNAYPDVNRQVQVGAVPTSGSRSVYIHASFGPTLYCYKSDGSARYDSVNVNAQPVSASIQVTGPNGGESIDPAKPWNVKAVITGLKTLSLALYKNDQWYAWLATDMPATGRPNNFEWVHTHSAAAENFSEVRNGSAQIFKIYATGQKADGTGYVDDKSDAAFSFTGTAATTATYRAYLNNSATPSITTNNISRAYAVENCQLNKTNNPTAAIRCTWGDETILTFTPTTANTPTVTIDPSSLTTTSHNPTITGSATGLYSVEMVIYNSAGSIVGVRGATVVTNGRWSMGPVAQTIPNGTHRVVIKGRLNSADVQEKQYAEGTLTVNDGAQTPLNAPTGLTAACSISDATKVSLRWNPVTGANGFHLRVNNALNDAASCEYGWLCSGTDDFKAENVTSVPYTITIVPGRTYTWWVHSSFNGSFGPSTSATFSCGVPASSQPTATITAAFANTQSTNGIIGAPIGQSMSLWWNSTNVTSCNVTSSPNVPISGTASGVLGNIGIVSTNASTTYTVSCAGAGGSVQKSVIVHPIPGTVIESGGEGGGANVGGNSNLAAAAAAYQQLIGVLTQMLQLLK